MEFRTKHDRIQMFGEEPLTRVIASVVSPAGWRELYNLKAGRDMTILFPSIRHHLIRR
jgi:hypothetical protein